MTSAGLHLRCGKKGFFVLADWGILVLWSFISDDVHIVLKTMSFLSPPTFINAGWAMPTRIDLVIRRADGASMTSAGLQAGGLWRA